MNMFRARLTFVAALLILLCAVVIWRLFTVQVVHGAEYARRSKAQSQQRVVLKAVRGSICDRRGRVLARSVQKSLSVAQDDNEKTVFSNLTRVYPQGDLAGSVLGWVGRDGDGLGGVEQEYDRNLRGEDGWAVQQRDARAEPGGRRRYRTVSLPQKMPRTGSTVYLTIDMAVQRIVENVLSQTCEKLGAKSAMAMVTEPRTGRILAMAGVPAFDPNFAVRYPLEQRRNQCISRNYEPGSTYKLVSAAAALEQGLFNESDSLSGNNGVYKIYNQFIRDHKAYGMLSFTEALAYSSNVCFAKIANKLGNQNLYNASRNFGFGAPTRLSLPGEESGILHPVNTWSGRTRVTMAMGHEVSATLMQMASLYGAVANEGVLVKPRILDRVVDSRGTVVDSSTYEPVRRVVSVGVAHRLWAMLEQVVVRGTGKRAALNSVPVAGKTGTSQIFDRDTKSYSDKRYHASFIGFAPAQHPVLLCAVVVTEPAHGEAGGRAAAPAFREILEQIISHPDLEYAQMLLNNHGEFDPDDAQPTGIAVPMVCGLDRREAARRLRDIGLSFDFVGAGDRIVGQSPDGGTKVGRSGAVSLFTQSSEPENARDSLLLAVPDCLGKDLRDAVNILNVRGLVPIVSGAGFVKKQIPSVGTVVKEAAACSLYCSFES